MRGRWFSRETGSSGFLVRLCSTSNPPNNYLHHLSAFDTQSADGVKVCQEPSGQQRVCRGCSALLVIGCLREEIVCYTESHHEHPSDAARWCTYGIRKQQPRNVAVRVSE